MDIARIYGPQSTQVLTQQSTHRSEDVLLGIVDDTLTTKRADGSFWRLGAERRLHPRVLHLLHEMGFYGVYYCGHFEIDYHLITALVERWRPETHTFHFRVGEATITLQDVAVIWGLPVDGRPVTGIDPKRSVLQMQDYCHQFLGFRPEPGHLRGARLMLPALAHFLISNPVEDDTPDEDVVQYARGCALMLLGGTMCPDSSGVAVSILYLQQMEDIKDVRSFSWGSAVLARLYRELCTASQREKKVIGGAMQLLQIWAWSRIKLIVPKSVRSRISKRPEDEDNKLPRPSYGARWTQYYSYTRTTSHSIRIFRDMFDRMMPEQFIWQPYDMSSPEITMLPKSCNTPAWRSRCPLINYAIVEMHRPERVMRQFGMSQFVPDTPPAHQARLHDIDRRGRAGQNWAHYHRDYVAHWTERDQHIVSAPVVTGSDTDATEPRYMTWYDEITRRLISPSHLVMQDGYQPSDTTTVDAMGLAIESLRLSADETGDDLDSLLSFRNQVAEITADLSRLYRRQRSAVCVPQQETVPPSYTHKESRRKRSRADSLAADIPNAEIPLTK